MENTKQIVITEEGKEALLKELNNLKEVVKPDVLARLKEAREQGDLSENSDYDAARNQQGQVEARIREIETILNNCQMIDETDTNTDVVHLGQYVEILREGQTKTQTYKIVGETEADPLNGKISNECALAKAVLNKPVSKNPIEVSAKVPYKVYIKSIKVK